MSSLTHIFPLERNRWFRDRDGVPATVKTEDEVVAIVLDWTDLLASGETISTSTWVDNGVTTSSRAIASLTTTCNVTGADGETENTIVTSSSRTLQRVVRFYAPQGVSSGPDYGLW